MEVLGVMLVMGNIGNTMIMLVMENTGNTRAHVLAGHMSSGPALLLKTCGTKNFKNNYCIVMKVFTLSLWL